MNDHEAHDGLDAAHGIIRGLIVGLLMWVAIGLLLWLLISLSGCAVRFHQYPFEARKTEPSVMSMHNENNKIKWFEKWTKTDMMLEGGAILAILTD